MAIRVPSGIKLSRAILVAALNGSLAGCILPPSFAPSEGIKKDPVVKGPFKQIAIAEGRGCGLREGGEVSCWKMHVTGYMPARRPDADEYNAVRQELPGMRSISLSRGLRCGVAADGNATCWGHQGVLSESYDEQTRAVGDTVRFVELDVGSSAVCGIAVDRRAWCWGYRGSGVLGTRDVERSLVPLPVLPEIPFKSIAIVADEHSEPHACGVTETGDVWCWGGNEYGQVSGSSDRGSAHRVFEPRRVPLTEPATMVSIAGGRSCALTTGGRAWCWGDGIDGALGVPRPPEACGERSSDRNNCARTPVRVATTETFTDIAVATHHACALATTGETWCWGAWVNGELRPGDRERMSIPRRGLRAPRGSRFVSLASGADRTCAVDAAGDVHCWRFTLATAGHAEQQARSTRYFLKQMFVVVLFGVLGWRRGSKRGRALRGAIIGVVLGVVAASLWAAWDFLSAMSHL